MPLEFQVGSPPTLSRVRLFHKNLTVHVMSIILKSVIFDYVRSTFIINATSVYYGQTSNGQKKRTIS